MRVPDKERGAALLTVLLLVAVMATIASAALDRIGVGTRFVGNVATVAQGRAWLEMAEQLSATRIEDALAADSSQTLARGWLNAERNIDLPDGSVVRARVEDGGNCFNLNSLVQRLQDGRVVARPLGGRQFAALMTLLGINGGEAANIATAATEYIAGGGLMADPSELRLVEPVTDRHYRLIERWICALPEAELSPLNVNTLLPEQAPLLAMLVPGGLDVARARAQLMARPSDGYGSVLSFWQSPAMAGVSAPSEVTEQIKVRTRYFTLRARVRSGDVEVAETAMFDARTTPVRLLRRQWGQSS